MAKTRRRLEDELVSRGLLDETAQAREAIRARRVLIDGAPARTGSTLVDRNNQLSLIASRRYVSRAGEKLEGALLDLGVDPSGKRCLDAGAGHGGFTDCLLQHGAAAVVAVDVGYGQLHWRLRNDPRVVLLERTNIRDLTPEAAGGGFDLVLADLSFIGLKQIAGALANLAADKGSLLLMVKPQHEAPRAEVGEGGIVRDPAVWSAALRSVASRLAALGFGVRGAAPARLKGAGGNQEFFLLAEPRQAARPRVLEEAVKAAEASRAGAK